MNTQLEEFQKNIKRLSEITGRYETEVSCGLAPPKVYELGAGKRARVWVLFEDDDVSIFKASLDPAAVFPIHVHENSREMIVVYRGGAIYRSGNIERRLMVGDCVNIPKGKAHQVIAGSEGAWFAVTSVPRDREIAEGPYGG